MKALPHAYEPAYRLAWIHLQTGELEAAQEMTEYAEARAYGPRKARVQQLRVQIAAARKDRPGQVAALEAAIATYRALPPGQVDEKALAAAQKALQTLMSDIELR